MSKIWVSIIIITVLVFNQQGIAAQLPLGFVYLKDIDPSILQEIRYAGYHNFIGRPIAGYNANTCIVTQPAAEALQRVQAELNKSGLSLKVYDCYRPQRAVNDFINWSKDAQHEEMKKEFYPRVNKAEIFKLGYVNEKSGHSRGSTIDLTIVLLKTQSTKAHLKNWPQKLVPCFSPYTERFADNSIDMGTGFDCLDRTAHYGAIEINFVATSFRQLLKIIMEKYGFIPYNQEWWHFTLANEPYPNTYFDFPVS